MRAAVVGAGRWGKNIVRTLSSMDALHSVVELDAAARNELIGTYPDLRTYERIEPVLESDVPVLCVAVHAPEHYAIARQVLESGKDVFIEKPMTLSVMEAEGLVELARERERVLMVGHLLLYQPAVQWIKGAVGSGLIGELRAIHQRRLALGRARDVENVLWSLGVHDVAVALYLTGTKPVAVEVQGQRILQPAIEDDVHLEMTFPGGVQNYLHCGWLWPVTDRGMTLVGTDGMLVYNELDQTVTLHRKTIGPDLQNRDNGQELVFQGSGQPLALEMAHFLECCSERKRPISDGESGIEVIRVLETASERFKR